VNERVKNFFPKNYRLMDRNKKFIFSKTEGRDPLEVFIEAVDNVLYQSSVPKFVNVQRKKCINWLLENEEFVIYNSSGTKLSHFIEKDIEWKDYCNSFLSYSVPSIPFLFAYSQSIGINLVIITDSKEKFFVFIQNPASFRFVFLTLSEGVYYRAVIKSK
jgi:predicted ATPase